MKKTLLLIPILVAAAALSVYFATGNSGKLPVNSLSTASQNRIQTIPSTDNNVKSITIRLSNDGFNGTPDFRLYLKQNDHVKITFIYDDKLGDFHPIYLTGYDLAGPTLSPQNTQGSLEFTANEVGKFGLICLNGNCKSHDKLTTALVIVSA